MICLFIPFMVSVYSKSEVSSVRENIFLQWKDRECFTFCISSFSPMIDHGFWRGYKVDKSGFLFSEQVCSYNFFLKVVNRIYAFETAVVSEGFSDRPFYENAVKVSVK